MASGAGYYTAAVITTVVVLVSLWPLRLLAYRVLDRPQRRVVDVELRARRNAAPVLGALEALGVAVDAFVLSGDDREPRLELQLDIPHEGRQEEIMLRLGELEEVRGVRWVR